MSDILREIINVCKDMHLHCKTSHVVTWIAAEIILNLDFSKEQLLRIAKRTSSDIIFDATVLKMHGVRISVRQLREVRSLERRLNALKV